MSGGRQEGYDDLHTYQLMSLFFCCVTVKVAVCSADGGAADLKLTRLSALPTISLPSLQESAGFVLASCSCNIKTKTELHALSHPLVMDCNKFQ